MSSHSARHTFATIARNEKMSLSYIQQILRHSSLIITQRYLDSLLNQEISDEMERVFGDI